MKEFITKHRILSIVIGIILLMGATSLITTYLIPTPFKEVVKEDVETKKKLDQKEKEMSFFLDSLDKQNSKLVLDLKNKEEKISVLGEKLTVTTTKLKYYIAQADKGVRDDSIHLDKPLWDSIKNESSDLIVDNKLQKSLCDSTIQTYKALVDNISKENTKIADFNFQMKMAYEAALRNEEFLYKEVKKLNRKNNKQFNLSIGIGYGISADLQPKPYIGLTLGKTLMKF